MVTSAHAAVDRRQLAAALVSRLDQLLDVWQELGDSGPTRASQEAGPPEMAREKYLRPLARALAGALNGSANHAALYFDERLRYVDRAMLSPELRGSLTEDLAAEIKAISVLLADLIPPHETELELVAFHQPLFDPPAPAGKILFIGDCLFVETRAFLSYQSAISDHPVDVRHIFFSTKQPMANVNTAIVEEVKRYRPDLIGLSLFTFEGVPPYTYAWRRAARPLAGAPATASTDGLVELVRTTVADIRTVSDCTIAVHLPCGAALHGVRRRLRAIPAHSGGQRKLLASLSQGLRELIDSTENALALDEASLVGQLGGIRAAAAPVFAEDDVPSGHAHTSRLGPVLAGHYGELMADYGVLGGAKVLLVDFDNTLWQGVMAEGEVVQNVDAQRLLLKLKNAGIVLVALSKNDESSIRWDEMVLSKDDFALTKINWRPKPDNVAAAIAELDLAPDAFVLLDDNPAERALVTEMVSGVKALDSTVPAAWRALRRWLEFPSTRQTEEARRRTIMYREAAERRAAMAQPYDYETMMSTLGLRYRAAPAAASDLPRLIELIQRTNQFNTTTRRRDTAEIKDLLTSDAHHVYVATLRDKFGSLGVVAVAIFDRAGRLFDSVIMSCRAMGFGLEFALLRTVMDAAGPGPFHGEFVATDRNGPAAELFAQAGFVQDRGSVWSLPSGSAGPQVPSWLNRE
jgi:FkbH-like protein